MNGQNLTTWIGRFKEGDPDAVAILWQRLGRHLARLARRYLLGCRNRWADEEDVANSAFFSLWCGTQRGRFADVCDQKSLWSLLRLIVRRKAIDYRQHERRQKRGEGMVRGESAIQRTPLETGIDALPDRKLSASVVVESREHCEEMLAKLGDARLRQISILKMSGLTNEEIADQLSCSRATIARKLDLIRRIWRAEGAK